MQRNFLGAILYSHKFPGLSVLFLQFIPTLLRYSSTFPHNAVCLSVQCHYLIPSIQFSFQNQFCPPETLNPGLIFHFLFFYSVILQYPRYLYPSSSSLLSFHHLVILSRQHLPFPVFIIITPHFLICIPFPCLD